MELLSEFLLFDVFLGNGGVAVDLCCHQPGARGVGSFDPHHLSREQGVAGDLGRVEGQGPPPDHVLVALENDGLAVEATVGVATHPSDCNKEQKVFNLLSRSFSEISYLQIHTSQKVQLESKKKSKFLV